MQENEPIKNNEHKKAHGGISHNASLDGSKEAQHGGNLERALSKISKHSFLSAFIFYLIVSMVIFYPLMASFGGRVFGFSNNAYMNLWISWWSTYALFHHAALFHTNLIYWPIGTALQPGYTPIEFGFTAGALGFLGVVSAYNLLYILSFALCGATMYLLAEYLIKDKRAAMVAGAIFAFSSAHISQSGSINNIMIFWLPLFVYFTLKTIDKQKDYLNIVGMSLSFALLALSASIAQDQMALFALIGIILYYIISKERRYFVLNLRFAANILLFAIIAFVFGSIIYLPLLQSSHTINNSIAITQGALSSFSIASYLNPLHSSLQIYDLQIASNSSSYVPFVPIDVAYVGFLSLILAIYGVYKNRKSSIWLAVSAIIAAIMTLGFNFLPGAYLAYLHMPIVGVAYPETFFVLFTMALGILSAMGFKEILKAHFNGHIGIKNRSYLAYAITLLVIVAIILDFYVPFLATNSISYTSINPPKIYSLLPHASNFSVLSLPALPTNTTNPYYYMASGTYYTSISHAPIVGGYIGVQNSSQYTLLYNLPLVVQAYNLQNTGSLDYSSPIYQNISNETLLTLYNYGTSYVILNKKAYNASELDSIGVYLIELFGAPIQNDNQTATFSTKSAVYNSIYKSYVAYPVIKYWNGTAAFVNGSAITEWHPSGPGAVVVYSPYQNQSAASSAYAIDYINTTISLYASAASPENMTLAELVGNKTEAIGTILVGKSLKQYKINALLPSGPIGSSIFFIKEYSNDPISVADISFSRS